MKKKFIIVSSFVLALATPLVVFAAVTTGGNPTVCKAGNVVDFQSMLCKVAEILNAVIPVLIALAIVYFVWGVVQYVIASDEEAKASGRMRILWGIIGLAVILGVWGLVAILDKTFGLDNNQTIVLPTVQY